MSLPTFSSDATLNGELTPWEVAKAYACHVVLKQVAETLEMPAAELLGKRVDDFIAEQVVLKGSGHPTD